MVNASMDEHMHNMNDMFSLIKEIKMYLEYINNIHMYEREPTPNAHTYDSTGSRVLKKKR
jgi:uncharacterized protein with von Willebrand factor type A (vWA) domain